MAKKYIPDLQFRKRDPRFLHQQRFQNGIHPRTRSTKREAKFTDTDFRFDAFRQLYVCPQGKFLCCGAHHQRNRYRVYDIYRARPQDCVVCLVRSNCLSKLTTSCRDQRQFAANTARKDPARKKPPQRVGKIGEGKEKPRRSRIRPQLFDVTYTGSREINPFPTVHGMSQLLFIF